MATERRQLAEQLEHAIEGGGIPRDQALPGFRELAGFLGINPNTVARVIEDLKQSGYVEARRGQGVFVAPVPPAPSVAPTRPIAIHEAGDVLLVECSRPALDFFARELEGHLPVRVDKVLLGDQPTLGRGQTHAGRWRAAVTSFGHLPDVERFLRGRGVPVIAVVAEAHLETLHQLVQLAPGTRVGVVSAAAETAHNLEHSIANAGLANIVLVGACPAAGGVLGRLVRRVDVVVCSTTAAERVRGLAGSTVQVVIDDRALDPRAIERLAAVLVRPHGDGTAAIPRTARGRLRPRPSNGRKRSGGATGATVQSGVMRVSGNRVKEEES